MDIDSVTDMTQQAAMRTMVKTYGQMPAQLFREAHPPKAKTAAPVLTMFRMRLGNALRRFTSTSSLAKVSSPAFWSKVSLHKARIATSDHDCDFVGAPGTPELIYAHTIKLERTPETLTCVGHREVVLTGKKERYVQNTSPAHSSLLLAWGNWDNSLMVQSTVHEAVLRLNTHPFNKVRTYSYEGLTTSVP